MSHTSGRRYTYPPVLTDNERLHGEGVADEASGSVQEGFGRGRRKVGEAIENLGDKLKR